MEQMQRRIVVLQVELGFDETTLGFKAEYYTLPGQGFFQAPLETDKIQRQVQTNTKTFKIVDV